MALNFQQPFYSTHHLEGYLGGLLGRRLTSPYRQNDRHRWPQSIWRDLFGNDQHIKFKGIQKSLKPPQNLFKHVLFIKLFCSLEVVELMDKGSLADLRRRGESNILSTGYCFLFSNNMSYHIYIYCTCIWHIYIYTQLYTCTRGSPHQSKKDYSLDVVGKKMPFLEIVGRSIEVGSKCLLATWRNMYIWHNVYIYNII